MADTRAGVALIGGVTLLERAVSYLLGSLHQVDAAELSRATPCRGWTLDDLLCHLRDSMDALVEAAEQGQVTLEPHPTAPVSDPVAAVRQRANRLLGAWTGGGPGEVIAIGGCPVTASIAASAGALELAVHGWDIARARGLHRPLPESFAEEMLPLSELFVRPGDRPGRFGDAVPVRESAPAGDRLLGFLGRQP